MLRFIRYTWAPLIAWIVIIILESSFGSSANTGALLWGLVHMLYGEVDTSRFDILHYIMRKGGHVLGYCILGCLWFRAFAHTLRSNTLTASAALAIVCTTVVAALDEWHQSFLPERTGALEDVAIDVFGATALISLILLFAARRSSRSLEVR
jgi:VanZ family protein